MQKRLIAGFAKIKITPEKPVALQGLVGRDGLSKGVFLDLYAKAAYFSLDSAKQLLLSLDIIGVTSHYAVRIRNRINESFGINVSDVMICATHTHCAPYTIPLGGSLNEDYLNFLEQKIIEVVRQSISNQEEVTAGYNLTSENFNVNRRLPGKNGILFAPNPDGACDKDVVVLKFNNLNGKTKAVIFNYACHPTVWGGLEISSDFPGTAEKYIESQLNECTAIFINGACGNIRADVRNKEGTGFGGSKEDVLRLGSSLGRKVIDALPKTENILIDRLLCRSKIINAPLYGKYSVEDLQEIAQQKREKIESLSRQEQTVSTPLEIAYEEGVLSWAQKTMELTAKNQLMTNIGMELQVIAIGELILVGLPGEVFCELGRDIKQEFAPLKSVFIGYANGLVGYIPTAKALMEGGYEPSESHKFYGVPFPFAQSTEQIIIDSFHNINNEIKKLK